MKTIKQFIWILFGVIAFTFSCKHNEDVMPGKGNATFSMSTINRSSKGGRTEQTETPAAVLLSIEDGNGNPVIENKKLDLFTFGNGYVSESLELTEGDYKLVQFLVLNANDTIIYAAPMIGSELAQYVTNPLPISFTISKDASTTVIPQVLKVESTDNPASFGYVNFGFEVVEISTETPKLTELWIDEGYNIYYKTFFTYAGDLLIKSITHLHSNNVWSALDSTTYQYNAGGELVEKNSFNLFNLQPGQQPTSSTTKYTYYDDGKLKIMTRINFSGTNDQQFEFEYDALGRPASVSQKFYPSLSLRYFIKYNVNDQGEITNAKYYTANSQFLIYEYNYQYDYFSKVLPPLDDYDPTMIFQKHNLSSKQTIGYNLTSDGAVINYSCEYSITYAKVDNLTFKSYMLNPNDCFEASFDQTQYTYIYK